MLTSYSTMPAQHATTKRPYPGDEKTKTLFRPVNNTQRTLSENALQWLGISGWIVVLSTLILWTNGHFTISLTSPKSTMLGQSYSASPQHTCHPPLPSVLGSSALSLDTLLASPLFKSASKHLDAALKNFMHHQDIDSLSVGVMTPSGPVFENGYGVLRANETDATARGGPPNRNALYRIASISKMFASLEFMILKERGLVRWCVALMNVRMILATQIS